MRVLVTDDHPYVFEAIQAVIGKFAPGSEVDSAGSIAAAITAGMKTPFDIAMLDLSLPDAKGLEGLVKMRAALPDLPVVVFSATADRGTVLGALDAGAMGFIPKTSPSDILISALRIVLSGSVYVPPEALTGNVQPTSPALQATDLGLTPRQYDVMAMLLQGLSNKRICRQLNISESTVKVHMTAVLRALHATNRTQAVINAAQLGVKLALPQSTA